MAKSRCAGSVAGYTEEDIKAAFRRKAKEAHPDHGGTAADSGRLVEARDVRLEALDPSTPASDVSARPASVGKPIRFSQASLERVKVPPGQRIKYSDANGTGARLDATGPNQRHPMTTKKRITKTYRFGGQQRTYVMPSLFPLLGWKETETLIKEIDYLVSRGIDPAAERAKAKSAPAPRTDTFASVVAEFSAAYANRRHKKTGRPLSYKQVASTLRYLERAEKQWCGRDIKSVTKREFIEFLTAIAAEHPTSANRMHASLTSMFRWAEQREMVARSPLAGVERVAPEMKRERVLDVHEIRLVWEATTVLPYPAKQLIRMLLVTGQRLGEVSGMRRSEIVGATWTVPAARTKSARAQALPLPGLALQVIAECPQRGEFVFAGSYGQAFSSSGAAKRRLDARITELRRAQGLPPMAPWVLHTLRHVVATQMAGLGIDRFAVRRILNHVDQEVTGRYDHDSHIRIKRDAMDRWDRELRKITGQPPDNVTEQPRVA